MRDAFLITSAAVRVRFLAESVSNFLRFRSSIVVVETAQYPDVAIPSVTSHARSLNLNILRMEPKMASCPALRNTSEISKIYIVSHGALMTF